MVGLDPGGLTLGMGVFGFSPHQLDRWRALVAGSESDSVSANIDQLREQRVRIDEPELKRVPAPYPADHPQAELLRRKGLTTWIDGLPVETALGSTGPSNCLSALLSLGELFRILRSL